MRRAVLVALCLFVLTGVSFAQHIGPSTPLANKQGQIATPNFGIGYNYIQSTWDVDAGGSYDTDFEQNQAYLHLGAVFGDESTPKYEVFARIGISDFEGDDVFADGESFDGDTEPMYAVGIKGEIYQGKTVGFGAVLQGSYIDSFSDDTTFTFEGDNYTVKGEIESMWDVELAFPVHAKMDKVIIYGGPVVYTSQADLNASITDGFSEISGEVDIEENKNVGVFAGFAFRDQNFTLEIEGKYKSDFSVGAFASLTF